MKYDYDKLQDVSLYQVRLERRATKSAVVIPVSAKTTNSAMIAAEDELGKGWKAVSCVVV